MKKYLFTILVILSISLTLVGTAAAAPMASGTASLVSVVYVPGKGPFFTFSVSGEFSKSELNGYLHAAGGADYRLYCRQVDETTVTCTTSDKVSGVNVVLAWGGFKFWSYVPVAPVFCYTIYDWNYPVEDQWHLYGENCQDTRAEYGDLIFWDNPDYGTSPYIFLPESPVCPFYQPAEAYYYPGCPN